MQKIIFGISLDASTFHDKEGVYFFGQNELLRWLEQQLGFTWPSKNYEWLRIASFRKILLAFNEAHPDCFFTKSFRIDSYGTTRTLLAMRDELKLANWDFIVDKDSPARFVDLSQIEEFTQMFLVNKNDAEMTRVMANGFSDRFIEVESDLDFEVLQNLEITLIEPLEYLPFYWQRLFKSLHELKVTVVDKKLKNSDLSPNDSDLSLIQKMLLDQSYKGEKVKLKGDDSLVIYQVPRDYDGIESIAFHYGQQTKKLPFFIMPPELKLPDLIFESDGMPVSGNTTVSDLRPSQQVIKLAHAFLWHPIDLGKILEFLNLPYSPMHNHLASRLARALQQRPGFDNEHWHTAIKEFQSSFEHVEHLEEADIEKAMYEYRFWFKRKTYSQKAKIPKSDIFAIYQHLVTWSKGRLGSSFSGAIYQSIYRLALDMLDLLDAVDEQSVSMLDLEKLTEIVIQATPATFKKREIGAANFAQNPGAMVFSTKSTIWFNFVSPGNDYIPTKWVQSELAFLAAKEVKMNLPSAESRLRKWMRYQPFFLTQEQLILIVPEKVAGKRAEKHPLHFELDAMIANMDVITKKKSNTSFLKSRTHKKVNPKTSFLEGAFTSITPLALENTEQNLSVTGLEKLLFFPHTWVLRKQMKLYGSSLTKIKELNAIMGNIAHKAFESLLANGLHSADNEEIKDWFKVAFRDLIQTEGLPFLEYGKEPDLAAFRKKLYVSILSFVQALRDNRWKVVAIEKKLAGKLGLNVIKGITDVVLERDGQYLVVDLKWGGKTYRKHMLKNKEDIQLMLYARYFGQETQWLDTCFFIIREGTFITREDGLFASADLVRGSETTSEVYEEMYTRLLKTLDWRYKQLCAGQLELRITDNIQALEATYGELIFDMLPQKTESDRFDDYGILLGEVE